MNNFKLSLLISLMALLLIISAANIQVKAAVELPKVAVRDILVLDNFITTGHTNPTTVNLLYEDKFRKTQIKKGFNPETSEVKEYFRKGLADDFKEWGLNIKDFKFQHLAYREAAVSGAYKGYLVLLKNGSNKDIEMKWEMPE